MASHRPIADFNPRVHDLLMRALPPNMHAQAIDAECAVPLARAYQTSAPGLRAASSSSFAFGGSNVVLACARA